MKFYCKSLIIVLFDDCNNYVITTHNIKKILISS